MSSDELSLADDSQDELLSNANADLAEDMDDLFGDNDSDQEQQVFVFLIQLNPPYRLPSPADNEPWTMRTWILATMKVASIV